MNFDTWLNTVPEKKATKVELDDRRETLTEMMEDMNRMSTDYDNITPTTISSVKDIPELSSKKDSMVPLYNNNMYEEEWALYKGMTPYED